LRSGLSETQIQAVLSLLASFGADQATINNINSVLHGQAAAPSSSLASAVFTRNLELNDSGADVRALQQWLNAHGFIIATTGPGSPGSETSIFGTHTYLALIKLQKSRGLPQTGYLGPLTRAALGSSTSQ
jgi:peptidoglycan hydrolase-like protein with peptidoglycan-binding domain